MNGCKSVQLIYDDVIGVYENPTVANNVNYCKLVLSVHGYMSLLFFTRCSLHRELA